jgi:hypothetical protein
MKVLNLRCTHDHRFEGWFGSEDDFAAQTEQSRIACPMCGDTDVSRLPSAPRLNVAHLRAMPALPDASPAGADVVQHQQALWMQAVRHVIKHTEDVGERFSDEARRIHYGEAPQRGIRGQASRDEADALRDEGIEVMALPVPAALKGPLQ